nr:hypothetical protein [Tanacetum cinerariifolium]
EEIDIVTETDDVLPPSIENFADDPEGDIREDIAIVMINKDKFDDDYQIFMFDKVFSLLFAESEDTIFDPAQSRFSFLIALPKDELIQGSSRDHDSDIKNKQMLRGSSPHAYPFYLLSMLTVKAFKSSVLLLYYLCL